MADVPLQVISDNSSSERRITPSWSISQLKAKLEFVTGVPPSHQRLSIKIANKSVVPIEAADEDNVYLTSFPLSPYAELHVSPPTLHAKGNILKAYAASRCFKPRTIIVVAQICASAHACHFKG